MSDAWKEWLRDLKYDEETDPDGPVYGYAAEALAEIEKLETRALKAEAERDEARAIAEKLREVATTPGLVYATWGPFPWEKTDE